MSALETRIAEVLAQHVAKRPWSDSGVMKCSCGERFVAEYDYQQRALHQAHQAAVLAPVIRKAKAEALREAADKFQTGDWFNVIQGNAHVKIGNGQRVTDWLRARADKLVTE